MKFVDDDDDDEPLTVQFHFVGQVFSSVSLTAVLNDCSGCQSSEEFQGWSRGQSEGHWIQSTRCKQVGFYHCLSTSHDIVSLAPYRWSEGIDSMVHGMGSHPVCDPLT